MGVKQDESSSSVECFAYPDQPPIPDYLLQSLPSSLKSSTLATLHSRLTFKIKDENTSPSLEVEVKRVQVNSALVVKDFIADTIGTVLSLLKGPQFLPYIELCVLKPISLPQYGEDIRKSATEASSRSSRASTT